VILGYARVSTKDQNLDGQYDALKGAGAERIFADTMSGSARARPELDRLLSELRSGDVVVVTKYDRLARSLKDLLEIVDLIQARGAGFRSLGEDIDTTSPAGRLVFHVFASIAQFERERIVERTKEGLAAARKRGRVGGRPPALSPSRCPVHTGTAPCPSSLKERTGGAPSKHGRFWVSHQGCRTRRGQAPCGAGAGGLFSSAVSPLFDTLPTTKDEHSPAHCIRR
jgi:hypothetical protein